MKLTDVNNIFGSEFCSKFLKNNSEQISKEEFVDSLLDQNDDDVITEFVKKILSFKCPENADHYSKEYPLCVSLLDKFESSLYEFDDVNEKIAKIVSDALSTLKDVSELHTMFDNNYVLQNSENKIEETTSYEKYPKHDYSLSELEELSNETIYENFENLRKNSYFYDPVLIHKRHQSKTNYIHTTIHEKLNVSSSGDDLLLAADPNKNLDLFFSKAVIEQNASLIITLNNTHEISSDENPNVTPFWENSNLKKLNLSNNWKIENISELTSSQEVKKGEPELIKSTLIASDGNKLRRIIHRQYKNWRDQKPAPDVNLLLDCAKEALDVIKKNEKVIIHCKAGTGRTGVLALIIRTIQAIHNQLDKGIEPKDVRINITENLHILRKERSHWMLNKEDQFIQVHSVISTYLKNLGEKKE